MKTLDDLLIAVPGLRRLRSLNAPLLRILLDRRKGECTWCGDPIPPGRREWCGDLCVKAFSLRCDVNAIRRHVEKRDRGVCRQCGRDTLAAEEAMRADPAFRRHHYRLTGETVEQQTARLAAGAARFKAEYGYARGQWREVDHDPPVAEYGGLCDAVQLRLLCGACHADATAALAARRAAPRPVKGRRRGVK